jgi:hypothetical protein
MVHNSCHSCMAELNNLFQEQGPTIHTSSKVSLFFGIEKVKTKKTV